MTKEYGWPVDPGRDEFERITHEMRQEQHTERLTEMNATLNTWRVGRFRIDLRPRSRWAREREMVYLGRISIGWGR